MHFLLELNWLAVGQIILIDLLLGGDNAVVIALACRNLPPKVRMRGILWGTFGAVGIRLVFVAFAVTLLQVAWLKLAGGLLLFWIGIKLLAMDDDAHDDVHASERLLVAIRTIVVADLVMSIDNVVAVASAAEQFGGEHQLALVGFGIAVSIPIVIWGSRAVMTLMERYPVIVTAGSALLGYLAGDMAFSDRGVAAWLGEGRIFTGFAAPVSLPGIVAAFAVVIIGKWMSKRRALTRS